MGNDESIWKYDRFSSSLGGDSCLRAWIVQAIRVGNLAMKKCGCMAYGGQKKCMFKPVKKKKKKSKGKE